MKQALRTLALLSLASFFLLFMGVAIATRGGSSNSAGSSSTSSTTAGSCIITVNGSSYDVTRLEKTHSGGNVFKCGTDNTSIFARQHGTNYKLIAKYKI